MSNNESSPPKGGASDGGHSDSEHSENASHGALDVDSPPEGVKPDWQYYNQYWPQAEVEAEVESGEAQRGPTSPEEAPTLAVLLIEIGKIMFMVVGLSYMIFTQSPTWLWLTCLIGYLVWNYVHRVFHVLWHEINRWQMSHRRKRGRRS